MLPKVSGYSGFQSYAVLPYPSLKPGNDTNDRKEVFSACNQSQLNSVNRPEDKISQYSNYTHFSSTYTNSMKDNVNNEHYRKAKIQRRQPATSDPLTKHLNEQKNTKMLASIKAFRKTNEFVEMEDFEKTKTGVEHWDTEYKASIRGTARGVTNEKVSRPDWTYNKKAYSSNCKLPISEYKFKIGKPNYNPVVTLATSLNPLKTDDPLKYGTTQDTNHLPGYNGFIPTAKTLSVATQQGQGNEARKDFMKTFLVENMNAYIPGYSGHIPKAPNNQRTEMRNSCFNK